MSIAGLLAVSIALRACSVATLLSQLFDAPSFVPKFPLTKASCGTGWKGRMPLLLDQQETLGLSVRWALPDKAIQHQGNFPSAAAHRMIRVMHRIASPHSCHRREKLAGPPTGGRWPKLATRSPVVETEVWLPACPHDHRNGGRMRKTSACSTSGKREFTTPSSHDPRATCSAHPG